MKLSKLKFEDRFYFEGKKWSQFVRIKKPLRIRFTICCMTWPMCDETKDFSSNTKVKLIQTVAKPE